MKLKNIFICVAAAMTVLSGCSENEPILDKPETLEPTTMSIRIDAEGTIISKADADQVISNMYVLIFKDGSLVKAEPIVGPDVDDDYISNGTEENPTTAENVKIEVNEGPHQVLVLANVQDISKINEVGKALSAIQAELNDLSAEVDGSLTMSSEVMSVTFLANVTNKIGYSTLGTNEIDVYPALNKKPVDLYRSVARIQLTQIGIETTSADPFYGEPQGFLLKEAFVANVKGYSHVATANNTTLSIEASTTPGSSDYLWWYGSEEYFEEGGVLKDPEEGYFPEAGDVHLSYKPASEIKIGVKEDEDAFYPVTASDKNPIDFFYVYENETAGVGEHTLLVLKGDYTYKKEEALYEGDTNNGDGTFTATNRFYAIRVNLDGTISQNTHRTHHSGIIRNTIYSLYVTLTGPGSELPYDPEAYLYYNTQVTVADWYEAIAIGTEENPKEIN